MSPQTIANDRPRNQSESDNAPCNENLILQAFEGSDSQDVTSIANCSTSVTGQLSQIVESPTTTDLSTGLLTIGFLIIFVIALTGLYTKITAK